ncbi:hypothetical protein MRX96_054606 [Rhipicephalus microplus]
MPITKAKRLEGGLIELCADGNRSPDPRAGSNARQPSSCGASGDDVAMAAPYREPSNGRRKLWRRARTIASFCCACIFAVSACVASVPCSGEKHSIVSESPRALEAPLCVPSVFIFTRLSLVNELFEGRESFGGGALEDGRGSWNYLLTLQLLPPVWL